MIEPVAQEEALQQAKILVSAVAGVEPAVLAIHADMALSPEQLADLGDMLSRRVKREPLQYILGEWEFFGLPFYADARALIPRQDTELLVQAAIERIRRRGYQTCLDLCTGSGCVGICIAKQTGIDVTASDISADALALAGENAERNEVRLAWIESDLFRQIDEKYDLIVCNPPYLSLADMQALQPELAFEPRIALYGGGDGLDFYRKIAWDYPAHLRPGGALLLEIGNTQAEAAAALFDASTSVLRDYSGNPRVLVVEEGPSE